MMSSETPACMVQVMKTLKSAMQTSVTDLHLEWHLSGRDKLVQVPSEMPPVFSGDRLIVYAVSAGQEVRKKVLSLDKSQMRKIAHCEFAD